MKNTEDSKEGGKAELKPNLKLFENSWVKKNLDYSKLMYFQLRSNVLSIVDIKNLSKEERKIALPEPINRFTLMCQLPNNRIFCYGNWLPMSGLAFIIHSDFKIELLSSGKPFFASGGVYFNGKVYVFGGYNGKAVSASQIYSLQENRWQNTTDLQEPGTFSNCDSYKGKILLSGIKHSKLYIYDTFSECYTDLLQLTPDSCKIICVGNSRGYVLQTSGDIFESEEDNIYSWKSLGNSSVFGTNLISYKVYLENSVYFIFCYGNLYQFNLSTKKTDMIVKIE
ncbi:unnamed protein product [Blepharisma stoltei]|uniref:Uncharacterized protein n=1 Tax=Blepharisma stoltei TaxID=1481888 RepID=A0AAU9JWP2_9CILI|nr:unnamed protein product [Blepharisma stoltei]